MEKSTILLDLGGVVFQSTGLTNEKIKWLIIRKLNAKYSRELNLGKGDFKGFLAEYNHLTSQNLSEEEFLESIFDTLEINTELINFLHAKSEIIIVSDNYPENIAYISKRYEFNNWSKGQIYSYDFGLFKSNSNFFKKLKKELNEYSSEGMLLIDDDINNIESAAREGIEGILFQNIEQIKRELKEKRR